MRRGRPGSACIGILLIMGSACVVAAPSKLQRPAGDRVKTDARDAELLARLLKLDEIVEVTVPSVAQEAARDLVRAREDVRGDLMRARHRLSQAAVAARDRLDRGQALDRRPRRLVAVATVRPAGPATGVRRPPTRRCCSPCSGGTGSMQAITDDGRGQRLHRPGAPAGLPAGDLHVDRVRAGGGDRRLAPVQRVDASARSRLGAHRALLRAVPVAGLDHQDREQPCPPVAGRGGLAPPQDLPLPGQTCGAAGSWRPRRPGPAATKATSGCTNAGKGSPPAGKEPVIANVAIARELAGWAWSLAVHGVAHTHELSLPVAGLGCRARDDPRSDYEQPLMINILIDVAATFDS